MNQKYKLIRSHRRTVCLLIKDGELVARAPYFTPKPIVDRFIMSKSDWIERHLQKSKNHFKREYKEGETFLYHGKNFELKIIKTNLKSPEVKFDEDKLVVLSYDTSKKFIKLAIEKFYRIRAQKVVNNLIKEYDPSFRGKITIKSYKSKWGSCSAKNDLTFNLKLAMTPFEVIKYVISHELSHINEKNHSKRFWQLVKLSDEKYNEKRKWLRLNNEKLVL